jgi:hypothetical protein
MPKRTANTRLPTRGCKNIEKRKLKIKKANMKSRATTRQQKVRNASTGTLCNHFLGRYWLTVFMIIIGLTLTLTMEVLAGRVDVSSSKSYFAVIGIIIIFCDALRGESYFLSFSIGKYMIRGKKLV